METGIDYARYRTYSEIVELLEELQGRYPRLLSVSSIGTSYEGRAIPMATITNRDTGSAEDKPAAYFDANIHAGEVTGSAVALYTIGYVLDNYEQDERIREIVDTRTMYIIPRVSVDGAEVFLTTPQTLRSSTRVRPRFEEENGIQPEDIDGDGHILNMRIADPRGAWKVSEHDDRLMIPRQPGDCLGNFYHLFTEGRVSRPGQEPVNLGQSKWNLDLNRNFPAGWKHGDTSGPFPLSEPETTALVRFITERDNISIAVAYHTSAGIIMRPPFSGFDRDMDGGDFGLIDRLAERGTDITGYPQISGYLAAREDVPHPAMGTFSGWAYEHQGIISFTIELWDAAKAAGMKIERNYGCWWENISEEHMLKFLKWNDRELDGKGYVPWQSFDHPELGPVEIGGWITRWLRQNPPLQYLPKIMDENCSYALELTAATPRVIIDKLAVEPLGGDLYRIRALIANTGFLPTSGTAVGRRIGVSEVEAELGGTGLVVRSGPERQRLGHLDGYGPALNSWFYLFDGRATEGAAIAEWVVEAPEPVSAEITVRGGRGGTARSSVRVGNQD